LMSRLDPGGIPEARPASLGAVPAQIYKLVCLRMRTFEFPIEASFNGDPLRNGINLTDRPIPRGYRRPGRRPHVPSSKPTMSKSRTLFRPGPCGSGHRLCRLRQAQNGARPVGPCSVAGEAYMESLFGRQHPVTNFSHQGLTNGSFRMPAEDRGPRSRDAPNRESERRVKAKLLISRYKKASHLRRFGYRRASPPPRARSGRSGI
jgi:hypothetical protein